MSDIVVFLGPSLAIDEAGKHLDAIYAHPAAQGSVIDCVMRFDPAAILLIDGVFESAPAIRHKEILWAMARGIAVYGAASMGALRAAELKSCGMIGVGTLYRWFTRYPLAPDDAVAVQHGPPEIGSPAMTMALVDLLATFRASHRHGAIDDAMLSRLRRVARSLNFRERTLEKVCEMATDHPGDAEELKAALRGQITSLKQRDSLMALERLRHDARMGFPARRELPFTATDAFRRDILESGKSEDDFARIVAPRE